jgi:thymidylate synthase
LKQYHDLLEYILKNGQEVKDRTGVGTISVFGYQMRFDLQEGFPAITTKKLAWKSVVSELLWFLEGSTDERRLAELTYGKSRDDLIGKRTIWTDNADVQGVALGYTNNEFVKQLGPIYGYVWSRLENTSHEIVEIDKRKIESRHDVFFKPNLIEINRDVTDDFIGSILKSNHEREYIVIDKRNTGSNSEYKIQFLDTHDTLWVTRPNLRRGQVGKRLVGGVGINDYYGKIYHTDLGKRIHTLWYNMIRRCYDSSVPEFIYYGGKGIRVCKRWHRLSNFVVDIEGIPNYYSWVKNPTGYVLDKDYYESDGYSPSTCVFIKSGDNTSFQNPSIDFHNAKICEFPDGRTVKFMFNRDLTERYPDYNFTNEGIRLSIINEGRHRGCKFSKVICAEGKIFRKKLLINQLDYVIDKIKNEPESRRIILTAWMPTMIDEMALPPCHYSAQFIVRDNKLSCMLNQRSADVFLGAPFNIASYALLTHILARECGISVGDLIYTIGDAHIYLNHIEQVREQLKREEYPLPELHIDDSFDLNYHLNYNFDLNSASLFTLKNYKHHDKIVAKMAV